MTLKYSENFSYPQMPKRIVRTQNLGSGLLLPPRRPLRRSYLLRRLLKPWMRKHSAVGLPINFRRIPQQKIAYEPWSAQCKEESVLPFQAFSLDRAPKRRTTTALVHKKKSEEITPGSTRLRTIRNFMKPPEAKVWVTCKPSSDHATYIPNHHFKVWLQYVCQVPLFEPVTRCTRSMCGCTEHLCRPFTVL